MPLTARRSLATVLGFLFFLFGIYGLSVVAGFLQHGFFGLEIPFWMSASSFGLGIAAFIGAFRKRGT